MSDGQEFHLSHFMDHKQEVTEYTFVSLINGQSSEYVSTVTSKFTAVGRIVGES